MLGVEELREVVNIGIQLTTEQNKNRLLEMMLKNAMDIAECDAATLYLYKDEALHFKIMKTLSQGVSKGENGEVIDLPPVPLVEGNVCAFSAIHRELINIRDVYDSDRFDFSGPKKYDAITGYRTGSMLVIPMLDAEDSLVGVLQLMNKLNEAGDFIAFTSDDEFAIRSLGSMAAISLSNMIYLEEIKLQMHSFARAFAAAVDARTPYNGTHTRKVTWYAGVLADEINRRHDAGKTEDYFDNNRKEQLQLAATLHDIGKMIVPLSVMNKETRLDSKLPRVESRFEILSLLYDRDTYKGRFSSEENENMQKYLQESLDFIREKNGVGFFPPDEMGRIDEIASHKYVYEDGRELAFLTEDEIADMKIVKGTLTADERLIMESHVVMTRKILEKVHFNRNYNKVIEYASTHHELLDGSGYPNHLTQEDLELETRILAIVDVYDALTCTDRPYKKPMPREKAFSILDCMVEEGKLEGRLLEYFKDAIADYSQAECEKLADDYI